MLLNFFKISLRNLIRNRTHSIINITGLSIGLTCALLIILYVKDDISFDKFHNKSADIYLIGRKMTPPSGVIQNSGSTGYFQGPRFSNAIPEISQFVRYRQGFSEIK